MAVFVVEPASRPVPRSSRRTGFYSGQIVASQAAAAMWLAAWGNGTALVVGASAVAVTVLLACWVRVRHAWLYQWLGLAMSYLMRQRTLPAGADLIGWISPGARVVPVECDGDPAGVVEDIRGRTALLELGHPAVLLADAPTPMPALASLLPATGIALQLIVQGIPPAAGTGAAAVSYWQLTEGRLLARQRAVLAVQALRSEVASEEELRHALNGAVRRIRRRLSTVGVRLLAEAEATAVLVDLAHHDAAQPAREGWHAVHLGGLLQATYRLRRYQGDVPHLLALPAAATTVSIGSGGDLAVRIAAANPTALNVAAQALQRLAAADRRDGAHARALARTLPLGTDHSGQPETQEPPAIGGAGLVLGLDRQGTPVMVRLLRAEPTRVLFVGGLPAAQLVALRALALGAHILVQTARPPAWEPFVRGTGGSPDTVSLVPPGRPVPGAGSPLRPQLVVVDTGPVTTDGPWRTTMIVRDTLGAGDLDLLAAAHLAVFQPLTPAEASLAAGAMGLGSAEDWLVRIRGDMVAVVNRRTVRWALLAATPVEQQLLGPVGRG